MVKLIQLSNAFTMISPLITWLFHRKKSLGLKHKATRLLLIHIPISFLYHLVSAFNTPVMIVRIFKAADLSLIHIYTVKLCNFFVVKNNICKQSRLYKFSVFLNTVCIIRVCDGHEDTIMRMVGLYICSYNALKNEPNRNDIALTGFVASSFFYFDDYLLNMGHSLFHLTLGLLHHKVLCLL